MEKKIFKWGQFNELAKEFGFKPPKQIEDGKKKFQREKFAKCRMCGGQMTYVPGTNILYCENKIQVERERVLDNGKKEKYFETQTCGNMNIVDRPYIDYMNYLFKE